MVGLCPCCGRNLWLTDDEIAGGWVGCECGQPVNVRQVQEQHLLTCALAANDHAQGTAAAISALLKANGIPIRRQTIAQWKKRGILAPCGMDSGKPVFRVWEVWLAIIRNGD